MGVSHVFPLCFALPAAAAMSAAAVQAQGGVHVTPSVSINEQYDSNVFSTSIDPQPDVITRATVGLELQRATPLWIASGRYVQDLEQFSDHRDLGSMAARQRGTIALRYRRSLRTSWAADAEVWRTGTPSELNEATGLTLSRASAQRLLAHSSIDRHLSPVAAGTLDYTVTQDHLAGHTSAITHDAVAGFERHRSSRETVSVRYRFREFMFTPAAAPTFSATSHAITAGLSRAVTPRLRLTLEAGPRVTNTTPAAEVSASLHYQRVPDMSVSYTRTQATVVGLAGVAEVQGISAAIEWPLWSATRLRFGPALLHTELGSARADAYVVGLDVTRPVTRGITFDLSVSSNLQRGGLNSITANPSIDRNVALIRLIAGPPSLLW